MITRTIYQGNFVLANFDFVMQSNCHGIQLGRRTSANHPHFDGTLCHLPARARADHALCRFGGRAGGGGWADFSFGFATGIWRILAGHGVCGGCRRFSHRPATGAQGARAFLVAADAAGDPGFASTFNGGNVPGLRCGFGKREHPDFHLAAFLRLCLACGGIFHAPRREIIRLDLHRAGLWKPALFGNCPAGC